MTRAERRPYLEQVAASGTQETRLGEQMTTWLCKQCRYHYVDHEYGDFGEKLYSFPDCSHPLPAVSEAWADISADGVPWYPPFEGVTWETVWDCWGFRPVGTVLVG